MLVESIKLNILKKHDKLVLKCRGCPHKSVLSNFLINFAIIKWYDGKSCLQQFFRPPSNHYICSKVYICSLSPYKQKNPCIATKGIEH